MLMDMMDKNKKEKGHKWQMLQQFHYQLHVWETT